MMEKSAEECLPGAKRTLLSGRHGLEEKQGSPNALALVERSGHTAERKEKMQHLLGPGSLRARSESQVPHRPYHTSVP